MSTAIATGLFTLGGVIVGGLINYFATSRTEAVRARKQVRTATRLVAEDIQHNLISVGADIEWESWAGSKAFPLKREAWVEHRGILASELSDEDWDSLRRLQGLTGVLIRSCDATDSGDTPLDDEAESVHAKYYKQAEQCCAMLDRYPLGPMGRLRSLRTR
jgi:hypothetical protein